VRCRNRNALFSLLTVTRVWAKTPTWSDIRTISGTRTFRDFGNGLNTLVIESRARLAEDNTRRVFKTERVAYIASGHTCVFDRLTRRVLVTVKTQRSRFGNRHTGRKSVHVPRGSGETGTREKTDVTVSHKRIRCSRKTTPANNAGHGPRTCFVIVFQRHLGDTDTPRALLLKCD